MTLENSKAMHFCRVVFGSLADLIFPPSCLVCGAPPISDSPVMFCPDCERKIKFLKSPLCSCCGKMFQKAAGDEHLCGECLTGKWHFDSARALVLYQKPISDVIHRFKYQGQTISLKTFSSLFRDLITIQDFITPDLVIPVPLHPEKLRQRGFNQAMILARALYGNNHRLVNHGVLARIRNTDPQTGLSGTARRRNLKNAFLLRSGDKIKNKNIVLVDDVFTTGTTVNECARVLKKAGAEKVCVFTLARVAE